MKRLMYMDRNFMERLSRATEHNACKFGNHLTVVAYALTGHNDLVAIAHNNILQFGMYHVYWEPTTDKIVLSERPIGCLYLIENVLHSSFFDLTKSIFYKTSDYADLIMYHPVGNCGFQFLNRDAYNRVKNGLFSMWVPPVVIAI